MIIDSEEKLLEVFGKSSKLLEELYPYYEIDRKSPRLGVVRVMSIQEFVNKTIRTTDNQGIKNALRIVKAEFQRERDKEVSDARAINIIRQLIKSEKERIEHIDVYKKGGSEDKAKAVAYIHTLSGLLPVMVGEEQIRDWVTENIDFSEFKNPMQAMKFILEHFGTRVDNKTAREVIEGLTKE